jgi:hypothetical protein
VRKRVVFPTAFPGRGNRIHHTLLEGFIVSMLIALAALLIVDSASGIGGGCSLLTEQMSMRSLKKDGGGGNLGAEMVRSSSLSEDDDGGDALDVDPNESSDSGDGRRGVALTVREGEAMISVGGRICWTLVEAISSLTSNDSQG